MPYICPTSRARLDPIIPKLPEDITPGELNYLLTKIILQTTKGILKYNAIATITGVLENVKQEFYRRVAAGYEDGKRKEHGDVY